MTEPARLADQIRRAFEGEAWHGDSVLELLKDVDAVTATAHPIPNAHSIWDLVLHIAAWDDAVRRRTGGTAVTLSDEENFPSIKDTSETAWRKALDHMKRAHNELVKAVKRSRNHACRKEHPAKLRIITIFTICSAASCSTSFTMPARSLS